MLTRGQQRAYNLMNSGENVFLTGEAGTGKSYVLRQFIDEQREKNKNIVVCAPSGIAAINVGGSTIHRTFGAPIEPAISKPIKTPDVIKSADIIIIDEISMCRIDLFDFVAQVIEKANKLRVNKKEREIQLIVVGDFCQLPPVVTNKDRKILVEHYGKELGNAYAFQSGYWELFRFRAVYLTEIMRQTDNDFVNALNKARLGNPDCIHYFNKKSSKTQMRGGIDLCSTNNQAKEINLKGISSLKTKEKKYTADEYGEITESDRPAEKEIYLKAGARVMMLTNDAENKWQNGSLGTVESLDRGLFVKLDNGNKVEVVPHEWLVERYIVETEMQNGEEKKVVKKEEIGRYTQIPLKLAYAITMHKSQGQTYDQVNISPSAWAPGQLYVALSRVKSIQKMHLRKPIVSKYLVASKDVVEFYQSLSDTDENIDSVNTTKSEEKEVDVMSENMENNNIIEETEEITVMEEDVQEIVPSKQKTKTTSFRLTEDTADKFKAFLEAMPGSREDAFIDLMDTYTLHHSKSLVPDREKEINSFQMHANKLIELYTRSLEICMEAEDTVKKNFDKQLASKDKSIADYQAREEETKAKLVEQKNELEDAKNKLKLAEKEVAETQKSLETAEKLAKVADVYLADLKEANEKLAGYPELKASEASLRESLSKAHQDMKDAKKDAEMEKAKALADMEREKAKRITELEVALSKSTTLLEEKTARIARLEKAEEKHEAKIEKLNEKLEIAQAEQNKLKEENFDLKAQLRELQAQIEKKNLEIEVLRSKKTEDDGK